MNDSGAVEIVQPLRHLIRVKFDCWEPPLLLIRSESVPPVTYSTKMLSTNSSLSRVISEPRHFTMKGEKELDDDIFADFTAKMSPQAVVASDTVA